MFPGGFWVPVPLTALTRYRVLSQQTNQTYLYPTVVSLFKGICWIPRTRTWDFHYKTTLTLGP